MKTDLEPTRGPRLTGTVLAAVVLAGVAVLLVVTWSALAPDPPAPGTAAEQDDGQPAQPAMLLLPGGEFRMGSPVQETGRSEDEGPQRQVTIAPFFLCQTEVTQAQYQAVMGRNPTRCEAGCGPDRPVQNVSWFDAIEYLDRRSELAGLSRCYTREGDAVVWDRECTGYRLPTEAEWEYAARAGSTTAYSFGDDPDELEAYGWYQANSGDQAQTVKTRRASAWGLHDMPGNVWEWVWDWYRPSHDGAIRTDKQGRESGTSKVLRGGSFGSEAPDLRSALRNGRRPAVTVEGVGFRCARSAVASPQEL